MKNSIIFSFFSGSGFLDLGFENNGFNIHFVNEYHQPFLDAYEYSRVKMGISKPLYGYHSDDVRCFWNGKKSSFLNGLLRESQSRHGLVGFIGGPPCPDFSIGGKNKGKDGENGILTKYYIDIIIANKPDFFVFENVKGLWRTKTHREFYEEMKNNLETSGYLLTNRLLNSIEYGTPQDRDRVILFGIKKELLSSFSSNEDLDKSFPWESYIEYNKNVVLDKKIWPSTTKYKAGSLVDIPENLIHLKKLTTQYWFEKNDVENHPNSSHFFTPRAGLKKFQVIDEGDDSRKSYKRLHRWRFSPTAAYGNNEVHLHPYQDRRLSAAEALAIQSLPKEFSLPPTMTLSNMFKTIGNGVPYNFADGIAKTIKLFFKQQELL